MSNPSSFSSISFDAETAKRFKETAKKINKTHTETLNYFLDNIDFHAMLAAQAEAIPADYFEKKFEKEKNDL